MKNIINYLNSAQEVSVLVRSENYSHFGYADVYRAIDGVTVDGQSVWVDCDSADFYTVPTAARELTRFDGAYLTRR